MTSPHVGRHQSAEVLHGTSSVASTLDALTSDVSALETGVSSKVWVPSTAMSTSITAVERAASVAGFHAFEFADAAVQRVRGSFYIPPGWTTATFTFVWSNASSGSGDVTWQVDYGPADAGFVTTAALPGTLVLATGTAGTQFTLSHSTTTAVAVDDDKATLFLVDRVGTGGGDTLTNAAWLHGLIVTKAS